MRLDAGFNRLSNFRRFFRPASNEIYTVFRTSVILAAVTFAIRGPVAVVGEVV